MKYIKSGKETLMSGQEVGTEKQEVFEFEADVPQVMSIIINSVYSSKELFLRELVSNASDALSKLMAEKQGFDDAGYETAPICSYKIQIIPDAVNKTLTIRDSGIGMTKADLKNFLGSIASSGTKKFREAFDKSKEKNVDALIGQFGLGFYSAFLVADRVDVITKHPKDDGYIWSSTGGNTYSIEPFDVKEHGTSVVLKLKEGEEEYLSAERLTELVKKHSMYIQYKISLVTPKKEEKKEEEKEIAGEVEEIKDENDGPKENGELEEKVVNSEIPVWTRKVEDIPEEELKKFYKTLSNDYDDYAAVQSWHFEGMIDLKILLFIPKKARFSFFDRQGEKKANIKLFNSNVFITDDLGKGVVPEWMNFIVGAVSSNDFPMNVSREFLQGKSTINLLKTKLPKCVAEMIKKMEKDKELFDKFYKEFSMNIKIAIQHYTDSQQETFARFLRYPTSKKRTLSLEEWMEANPTEKDILILTGLSKGEVENSLYLEAFRDREVILMSEATDEAMLQGFKKFKGMNIQMISSEGILPVQSSQDAPSDNPADADAESKCPSENASEPDHIKKLRDFITDSLKGKIERVEFSTRYESLPGILITTKYSTSGAMENIIRTHPGAQNDPMMMMMMQTRKIFEVNPNHNLIKKISAFIEQGDSQAAKKYVEFVFNSALLGLGFNMEDKQLFVKQLYEIIGSSAAL